MTDHTTSDTPPTRAAWSAVLAMTLCVAMLIASEFMPVSLLTPIADSLGASNGQIGQSISISGFFAVAASLFVTTLAGEWNRKSLMIAMSAFMLVSLILVASAPNFWILMAGRALLGICIGGFWSLATASLMRLVPKHAVSTALSIMYTGQAASAAFAAPIGSYLGGSIGWRGVFWIMVPLVALVIIWQIYALPSLPARGRMSASALISVLRRGYFLRGLAAVMCSFAGAFAMFTYLRPYLEQIAGAGVELISVLFLVLGVAGFLGTWLAGRLAPNHLTTLLLILPLTMGAVSIGLLLLGQVTFAIAVLLAIWGAMNTALSIGWMAWISQNVADQPEAGGSLIVAAIQTAILLGATFGGFLLDAFSITATFIGSAILCAIALAIIGTGRKLLQPR